MISFLLATAVASLFTLPHGDQIPDYSRVGYRWGDVEIPTVKVVTTLKAPKDGSDATALIQDAIDNMKKPGAILLKAGTYNVFGTIRINRDGVVIRGEGQNKTIVFAAGAKQRSLFKIGESKLEKRIDKSSHTRVCDEYVPYGSLSVPVEHPENFKEGDQVILHETHNKAWIHAIKMDRIMQFQDYFDRCVNQWTATGYSYSYERVVSRIEGNRLYFDNPVILAIYPEYGGAEVMKVTATNRISECGIENLRAVSDFDPSVTEKRSWGEYYCDEVHGWRCVEIGAAEHCWVRDITTEHFGYSLVSIHSPGKYITIKDCTSLEPVSILRGARRYAYDIAGQMCLFIGCTCDHDRHGLVTHGSVAGPNAYVRCTMTRAFDDAGPHNNWGVGTLYDCCKTDQDLNVQDRQGSGTGHGWAGASILMWNCEARKIVAQSVWGVHNNYVIGCKCEKWTGWFGTDEKWCRYQYLADGKPDDYQPRPDGFWFSHNTHVEPECLYETQMAERRAAGIKAVPEKCYKK